MGENPAMSDPDVDHAREALAALDHLVVQDIFLTETAYLADVMLPATAWPEKDGTVTNTDRMVQLGRKAIEAAGRRASRTCGSSSELAQRIGLDWNYQHVREVFNEMRERMDSIAGITWERLEREYAVTYPCEKEGDPGEPVVFIETFPTRIGRGQVRAGRPHPRGGAAGRGVPDGAHHRAPARTLAHRPMTRRASVLDAIEPEPVALGASAGSGGVGVAAGRDRHDRIAARHVSLYARADDGTPRGAVFVPFCYYEAAANMLTNPALDPFGKIPEFKYCAIRVTLGGGRRCRRLRWRRGRLQPPARPTGSGCPP